MQAHSTPGTYRASNAPKDLYDSQAEAALIYAAIVDARHAFDTGISPADFHDSDYGILWRAIGDMLERADPDDGIDAITLEDWIATHEAAEHHGRLTLRITNLQADMVNSNPLMAGEYAAIVKKHAQARRTVSSLQAAVQQTYASLNGGGDRAAAAAREAIQAALQAAEPTASGAMQAPASWADMGASIGPIAFDWPGWLARGFYHLLGGESGSSKSAIALRIAACYTDGRMWPDGTPFTGETGSVLWCEAESAQALNLERAKAWGLTLDRLISPFSDPLTDINLMSNPEHFDAIAAAAARPNVRLIVLDSLSGATGGSTKGDELMPVVKMMAELARDTGKPVLVLHHLRKKGLMDSGDEVTLDRFRDSSVIPQLARIVWALDTPDPNNVTHRRLKVIKSNLGRFPDAIGARVEDSGVVFDGAPVKPQTLTKVAQAEILLLRLLAEGPKLVTDIESEAILDNLSMDTMREAKKRLRLTQSKDGHTGKWSWSLPEPANWQDKEQDGEDE